MASNFGDHIGWDDGGWDDARPARVPGTTALPDTVADIAERLMGEFGGRLDLAVISAAVLDSVHDLECGPLSPEHIERLARHRLRMATRRDGVPVPAVALPPVTATPVGATGP